MSITENLAQVWERIERAAQKSRRTADDITLVAVTKTIPVEKIREAIEAGVQHIGENRVQEAIAKYPQLESYPIHWHLVGHLQRNKVKRVLPMFDLIHSLDSIRLMEAIERHAASENQIVDVLVQVNTSGEISKYGVSPEDALELISRSTGCEHLRICGLMTIGPLKGGVQAARASFQLLRRIRDQVLAEDIEGVQMDYLSMGMTGDFEVAIEEGANMIRVGTAIFGRRE